MCSQAWDLLEGVALGGVEGTHGPNPAKLQAETRTKYFSPYLMERIVLDAEGHTPHRLTASNKFIYVQDSQHTSTHYSRPNPEHTSLRSGMVYSRFLTSAVVLSPASSEKSSF